MKAVHAAVATAAVGALAMAMASRMALTHMSRSGWVSADRWTRADPSPNTSLNPLARDRDGKPAQYHHTSPHNHEMGKAHSGVCTQGGWNAHATRLATVKRPFGFHWPMDL